MRRSFRYGFQGAWFSSLAVREEWDWRSRQFLRRGAKVALLARDPEALERAWQLLAGKGTVFVRSCDVRDQGQVDEAVRDVRGEPGDIDVLVNNAGTLTVGPMETMTLEEYREMLSVFFWAPHFITQAVLPSTRQRRQGNREYWFDRRQNCRTALAALLRR